MSLTGSERIIVEREMLKGNLGPFFGRMKADSVAFSRDSDVLYVVPWKSDKVRAFELATKTWSDPFRQVQQKTCGLWLSPDGRTLVTVWQEGYFTFWDLAARRSLYNVEGFISVPDGPPLGFSADSQVVAVAGWDSVRLISVNDGTVLQEIKRREFPYSSVALSRAGRMLAFHVNGGLVLHDLRTGEERLYDTTGPIDLAFSPDGEMLASAERHAVQLRRVGNGECVAKYSSGATIAFSPDGQLLAIGDWYGKVTLWDWKNQKRIRTIQLHGTFRTPWIFPVLALGVWVAAAVWLTTKRTRALSHHP